jgi:hypothetical protein
MEMSSERGAKIARKAKRERRSDDFPPRCGEYSLSKPHNGITGMKQQAGKCGFSVFLPDA